MRPQRRRPDSEKEFDERVVGIRRVSKTVAGGKRFRFSALVVVGDGKGRAGVGLATATQTPLAIRKAMKRAEKSLVKIPLVEGTIPHKVVGRQGSTRVLLMPAGPGTGVIAGAPVRAFCEVAGVKNILTKVRGSTTPLNVLYAVVSGLSQIRDPRRLAALRNVPLEALWGRRELPS